MIQNILRVELPVGEELFIRKNRLAPATGGNGRRISIVTGIHGDELEGQYVCYELQRRIGRQPECLQGTVDIYPALNPLGIDSVSRSIPGFDIDMNRAFPGRQDGDMNDAVVTEIIRDLAGSDLCLDIHASNIFLTEVPQIRINQLHADKLLPLAKLANVDLVWVHSNATVLESTLAYSLNSRHTPTLVVEMGVGMRITQAYGNQLVDGILRLMAHLGVWRGDTPPVHPPVVSQEQDEVEFINAHRSGVWLKHLNHGAMLKTGDLIGEIVDPLRGEILSNVTSPADGWLFTIREYPVVDQGSLLARILKGENS